MATRNDTRAIQAEPTQSPPAPVPHHFRRLYRAFVQPQDCRGAELTAFVEAASGDCGKSATP